MIAVARSLLAAALLVAVPAGAPAGSAPANDAVDAAKHAAAPGIGEVEALLGSASLAFPGDGNRARVRVADRIGDGFQAGPSRLRLADGSVLHWGFKHGEANLQSIAVRDPRGRLRLLGAVNNLARLTSRHSPPLHSIGQYCARRRAARLGVASVSLFVVDAGDLRRYLPIVKRWLQADLMGFNTGCETTGLRAACALAATIAPPTAAYRVDRALPAMLSALAVPQVDAADVPLEQFVQ